MIGAAGGCAAMIRLLNASQAAAQDAAIFTIASLIKWNMGGVQRSFARNQGEAAGLKTLMPKTILRCITYALATVGLRSDWLRLGHAQSSAGEDEVAQLQEVAFLLSCNGLNDSL